MKIRLPFLIAGFFLLFFIIGFVKFAFGATLCKLDVTNYACTYMAYRNSAGTRFFMSNGTYNVDSTWTAIEFYGKPVCPGANVLYGSISPALACSYTRPDPNWPYVYAYEFNYAGCGVNCPRGEFNPCLAYPNKSMGYGYYPDSCMGCVTVSGYPDQEWCACFMSSDLVAEDCFDSDCDGDNNTTDCLPCNYSAFHGGTEICGNGIDEDCTGSDLSCFFNPSWGLSPDSMTKEKGFNLLMKGKKMRGAGGYERKP